jgi:phosphatidylglycerol---prolipoprotein diacylglyceryl transferase
MFPFYYQMGPLAITPNEVFTIIGAVLGGLIIRKRLIALGTNNGGVLDFILAGLGGGAVGARLYYFLPLWFRGQVAFGTLFSSWANGSGFYGAFIGGTIAFILTAKLKKMPVLRTVDAIHGVVPLGFAVGKIGCFLAGCCYGLRSTAGMKFAPGSLCYKTQLAAGEIRRGAIESLPVHPVPLYDMIYGFALAAALFVLYRKSKRPGEVLAAGTIGYSAYRFVIEFFRDDPDCHTFGSAALRDSQWTAIVLFVAAAAWWAWLRLKKPPETPPATPNKPMGVEEA